MKDLLNYFTETNEDWKRLVLISILKYREAKNNNLVFKKFYKQLYVEINKLSNYLMTMYFSY